MLFIVLCIELDFSPGSVQHSFLVDTLTTQVGRWVAWVGGWVVLYMRSRAGLSSLLCWALSWTSLPARPNMPFSSTH